jgi:hypothetical protein
LRNQRIAHLEAQVARRERPVQTVIAPSGYWNWIKPEVIASGTDGQAETAVDLSSIVGAGAREVLITAYLDYPVPGASEDVYLTLYARHPDISDDIPMGRLFADDEGGGGPQITFPMSGRGLRYKLVRTGTEGQFSWTLNLIAWR